VKQKALC